MADKIKLNLGSHNKQVKGFINVDVQQLEKVDKVWDLTVQPYPWDTNSVDEILMCEVLEHISFRDVYDVLKECKRILKINGKLSIQVPDIEKMINYYYEDKICDCVPRKAGSYEAYKADPDCPECKGKALIHPERWHFAFVGAQKHPYDLHRNIFTPSGLKTLLGRLGYIDIEQSDNIYKIIINCKK